MDVTGSFVALLNEFRSVFTAPTFLIFVQLMTGWVLSHRRRFVTELILSSGSVDNGHFSRYHRFFTKSVWLLESFSRVLANLLITAFVPDGVILLAVDDTLCRKRGLTVYGTGMHHDPLISSRGMPLVSWGHDWVVLCLIIRAPVWAPTKVWSLPICFRLYRNRQGLTKGKRASTARKRKKDPNHRTRPELAVEVIQAVSQWFPDRALMVTGDSAYGGASVLQKLPSNVDLISHVHPKGALYKPAPTPRKGQKGPRRKKGARLPTMDAWAKSKLPWDTLKFDQFGLHATLLVKTRQALYYKAGKDRLLNIILVRDAKGKRPDQMFYCTRLDWKTRRVLSAYACRWSIEVTFQNSKQLLGFGDPANRTQQAVKRTAPMALVAYSLVVLWFHRHGQRDVEFPHRPWYTQKQDPSFADMLTTLRALSWREKFRTLLPNCTRRNTVINQMIEFAARAA